MYFLADITKKVPIYVHFVEKLQTFDLRALGGSLDGGQFILFYDRATEMEVAPRYNLLLYCLQCVHRLHLHRLHCSSYTVQGRSTTSSV